MRGGAQPTTPSSFAVLAQAFFAEHLTRQRALSPRTVTTYRDAFVLFLDFAERKLRKVPTAMRLAEITPALILAFLDHLEHQRDNTVRSRNARLAALRAFLKYAAHRDISARHIVEQALGVPMKRFLSGLCWASCRVRRCWRSSVSRATARPASAITCC